VEIQRKCWIFRFRIMVKNQRLLEMNMMIALGLTSLWATPKQIRILITENTIIQAIEP
jgi:hypothetical protein